jgi:hypothetical protein
LKQQMIDFETGEVAESDEKARDYELANPRNRGWPRHFRESFSATAPAERSGRSRISSRQCMLHA